MPALRQLLLERPSTAQGIHEAMARYAEHLFAEYKDVVSLACGARRRGPFLNRALPDALAKDETRLLKLAAALVVAHDLELVSVLAAVAEDAPDPLAPRLGAILVTADERGAFESLPFIVQRCASGDIERYSRGRFADSPLASRERWAPLFERDRGPEARREALERLAPIFGD